MARQERAARRASWAAKKATQVMEQAVSTVKASRPAPPPQAGGENQAAEAKRLRDAEGLAWWVIGQRLGLAGEASSASDPEAKRGAGQARKLYAAANRGEVPRTQAPRKGSTPKPQGPGRSGTKTDRKIMLVTEGHVIPRDMPDDEVEELVRGRTIEWVIDLARLTDTEPESWGDEDKRWLAQDARVHVDERWVRVVDRSDEGKDRLLYFREYGGRDGSGRALSGPTRCVRVDAIHTIR